MQTLRLPLAPTGGQAKEVPVMSGVVALREAEGEEVIVEIVAIVIISAALLIVVGGVMAYCYALGYRNCAPDALKEMDEIERREAEGG